MQDKITIIGYSGHGYVVLDSAIQAGLSIHYYCEKGKTEKNPFDLEYLGFEEDRDFKGWKGNYAFVLGIGDNELRHRIGTEILQRNKALLNVVDVSASLSQKARFGEGIYIGRQVSVNALAEVGNFCILNTGCIIEHECKIGNGAHIAPGATLAGNVEIGQNTFVGANAVVRQGVKIGANVVVGGGSVVIKEILDNEIVVGNPGKVIKKK